MLALSWRLEEIVVMCFGQIVNQNIGIKKEKRSKFDLVKFCEGVILYV